MFSPNVQLCTFVLQTKKRTSVVKNILQIVLITLISISCIAQKSKNKPATLPKPKLVVGIVVDQMRYDYLYKFYDKYSEGGLKRLMNDGFNCRNNHYHYASTVTGPGHAHIFNGSVPAISGIVGNEFYDKQLKTTRYVVQDDTRKVIGNGNAQSGNMSPENMKVTSITDQLRIASQFKSKVIGVAIKDRGAILPAGHTGTAYWLDNRSGNWLTSDYYMNALPQWVNEFNDQKLAEKYLQQTWEPLLPLAQYTETEDDDQPYENTISGESKAVFPHAVKMSSLASTPWGNTFTLDFAMAALKAEKLGKGQETDFLCVSFSSPDYAGHAFGPQSKEIEDIYLRLDLDFKKMLETLDKEVGVGNYTVFLSADHGVAEIPVYLKKHNVPAGFFVGNELVKMAEGILKAKFGSEGWIINSDNYQLYLDMEKVKTAGLKVDDLVLALREAMALENGIYNVVNLINIEQENIPEYYKEKLRNIYNPKRSGEIMVLFEPAWFQGYLKGTTHGTMYAYDTHVPLLFYGWGIQKGETTATTHIADIAPTIAQLLHILEPNGSVGTPIGKALK